jgi:hypothetical protein
MNIVFDTNVIFRDWYLNGPNMILIETFIKSQKLKLVIPEIVIQETKNRSLLVPKLLLGNLIGRQAPLGEGFTAYKALRCPSRAWAKSAFPSRSLGTSK